MVSQGFLKELLWGRAGEKGGEGWVYSAVT